MGVVWPKSILRERKEIAVPNYGRVAMEIPSIKALNLGNMWGNGEKVKR